MPSPPAAYPYPPLLRSATVTMSPGLHYRSWAELARERPGLRPCGTRKSDEPFGPVETYVVLRPIADLEGSTP
jgi:hypothetical protein